MLSPARLYHVVNMGSMVRQAKLTIGVPATGRTQTNILTESKDVEACVCVESDAGSRNDGSEKQGRNNDHNVEQHGNDGRQHAERRALKEMKDSRR
jgi:hypothetical protein